MEHSLHLGAKSFLVDVCPTPLHFKKAKSKSKGTSAGNSGDEEEVEDDGDGDGEEDDEEDLVNEFLVEKAADNEEVDEVEDFEPGDLLGKVLALITQVRLSPQAKAYFATVCKEEGLKPLELMY
ncbi:hypothetical protein PAXRUDRAFT_12062 [Paxillus rubicundulus Ve08.2h10]|uniref:Uncharacterized protein n=1 Tax=Paxillus rubicundulus Ve08.2h10 TaxID=930991 RepID=A0A0D0E7Y6_9AGAM|nr:hypothetical protein PAXRUDRAFT_12062 [Paxillus rubicundulus Ve08.2h10]